MSHCKEIGCMISANKTMPVSGFHVGLLWNSLKIGSLQEFQSETNLGRRRGASMTSQVKQINTAPGHQAEIQKIKRKGQHNLEN